ncbi:MAG TPA: hypothetical protein VL337_09640 [Acidimicrobiales bacterium]|nr:hypothetical protein [Acidimicrobiales bacterium]
MPRHDLDAISLMAGVVFAGIAIVSLLTQGAGLAARWTWPVLLILAGVVGLLASRRDDDPPVNT